MNMFNISALASSVLDSLDSVAKDTLEDHPKVSATTLRKKRRNETNPSDEPPLPPDQSDHSTNIPPLVKELGGTSVKSHSSIEIIENSSLHGSNSNYEQPSEDDEQIISIPGGKSEGSSSSSNHSYQVLDHILSSPPVSVKDTSSSMAEKLSPVDDNHNNGGTARIITAGSAATDLRKNLSSISSKLTSSAMKLLDPANNSSHPPNQTSTFSSSSSSSAAVAAANIGSLGGNEGELKTLVRKKAKEIEALNQECLELEQQCSSLKEEVKEAWNQYKLSQEKAMFREQELLDEIQEIKNAKQLEKQNITNQFQSFHQEIQELTKILADKESEKFTYLERIQQYEEEKQSYLTRYEQLQQQLADSKLNTISGVNTIREELNSKMSIIEQMKIDHQTILRTMQSKISTLEQENQQLMQDVAESHKERMKLQNYLHSLSQQQSTVPSSSLGNLASSSADHATGSGSGGSGGGGVAVTSSPSSSSLPNTLLPSDYLSRENYALNKEIIQLSKQLEAEKEKNHELFQNYKAIEKEAKNHQFMREKDAQHYQEQNEQTNKKLQQYEKKIQQLQEQLDAFTSSSSSSSSAVIASSDHNNSNRNANINSASLLSLPQQQHLETLVNDYKSQVDHLSKMLLKKQSDVLELQTERSALKSKLQDLQLRCAHAEQQLASLRDVEEDGYESISANNVYSNNGGNEIVIDNYSAGGGGSGGGGRDSGGLLQRRSGGAGGNGGGGIGGGNGRSQQILKQEATKVLSDLEKIGVKPGAGMSRAVTFLDSWAMFTGRLLRVYPLARLGFVIYLLVLHLWVLFILVLQTHSLEIIDNPKDQLLN